MWCARWWSARCFRATEVTGATLRQAVVRLDGPRALLPCGDRPFLAWVLRELCRYGVEEAVLQGPALGDAVAAALPGIGAMLPRGMRLVCEPGAAALDARFLLCRGDTWLDWNLARLLAAAAVDAAAGLHMVLRPAGTAPGGFVDLRDGVVTGFRDAAAVGTAALVDAGIGVMRREAFVAVAGTPERDGLARLAAAGAVRACVAEGCFLESGDPAEATWLRRRALFLDRDGVINVDHGWVGTRERFEFVPGALAAVRAASDAGWHVFVVTNQSGIARGHYSEAAFAALTGWMCDAFRAAGGTVDDVRYCPEHPEAVEPRYRVVSDWRKPGPGMLHDLIGRWELDPARCVMVGDNETDMQAAAAAGVAGHWFRGGRLDEFVRPLIGV